MKNWIVMSDNRNAAEWIKRWRDLGFNVIPLPPRKKGAAIEWKRYQKEMYRGVIAEDANIAVVCGAVSKNLVVLDFESEDAYKKFFPDFKKLEKTTLIVKSGSGKGRHVYFRLDKPVRKFTLKPAFELDVQGEGSITVLPSSIHPDSGKQYEVVSSVYEPAFMDQGELLRKKIEKRAADLGYAVTVQMPKDWKISDNFEAYKGPDPPCIQMLGEGTPEGIRNEYAIRYASYLLNFQKKRLDKVKDVMAEWDKKNKPPLGKDVLEAVIKSALRGGYNYGCYDQILDSLCNRDACEIGEHKVSQEAIRKAEELAKDPTAFIKYLQQCLEYRVTNEMRNRLFLFICAVGAEVATSIIRVEGPNSTGKKQLYYWLQEVFGPDKVIVFSQATAAWFKRKVLGGFSTKGKVIVLIEDRGKQSGSFKYNFEQIYSEDKIKIGFNIRGESGDWEPIEIEMQGPLCFLTTTTDIQMDLHGKTREWKVVTNSDQEQTLKCSRWFRWRHMVSPRQKRKEVEDLEVVRAFTNRLKVHSDYRVPFVYKIDFNPRVPEDRRKEPDFCKLMQYATHLFQDVLPTDPENDIVFAQQFIFDFVKIISEDVVFISRGGLTPTEQKVWDYVKDKGEELYSVTSSGKKPKKVIKGKGFDKEEEVWEKSEGFTVNGVWDAAVFQNLHRETVSKALSYLSQKGYLDKLQSGRGRSPSVYAVAEKFSNSAKNDRESLLPKLTPLSPKEYEDALRKIIYGYDWKKNHLSFSTELLNYSVSPEDVLFQPVWLEAYRR